MREFAYVVACLLTLLSAIPNVAAEDRPDFRKVAKEAQWSWSDRNATLLGCIDQKQSYDYDVTVSFTSTNRHRPTITIERDEKPIYSWTGDEYSVFHIQSNTLYYASFWQNAGPSTSVVAVDLTTGNQIWSQATRGLNVMRPTSVYRIRVMLYVHVKSGVVAIWGKESDGRYYELKDIRTGKTVGHKVFPRAEELPNKELNATGKPAP
jgi:hypothetical protein